MDAPPLVAVEIPTVGDARRKHWAKVITDVDLTKSNGWAFDGEFVAAGGIQDVPVGSVVLVYGERGSRASPQPEAAVFVVNADATISPRLAASGRAWARTLRDGVAGLLDEAAGTPLPGPPALADFTDTELAAELKRRGYRVAPADDRTALH